MKNNIKKGKPISKKNSKKITDEIPPYPVNPPGEDIYLKLIEEQDIDPEDISKRKTPNEGTQRLEREELDFDDMITGRSIHQTKSASKLNEKDFDGHMSGRDLDVPGSELDDDLEDNGDEDEENNSYSIGGDRHEDLDEDRDE